MSESDAEAIVTDTALTHSAYCWSLSEQKDNSAIKQFWAALGSIQTLFIPKLGPANGGQHYSRVLALTDLPQHFAILVLQQPAHPLSR